MKTLIASVVALSLFGAMSADAADVVVKVKRPVVHHVVVVPHHRAVVVVKRPYHKRRVCSWRNHKQICVWR